MSTEPEEEELHIFTEQAGYSQSTQDRTLPEERIPEMVAREASLPKPYYTGDSLWSMESEAQLDKLFDAMVVVAKAEGWGPGYLAILRGLDEATREVHY